MFAERIVEPFGDELYATTVYSVAAAAEPVRQTFVPCTATTEPTDGELGVANPVHDEAPAASTLTFTVSERPLALTVIVDEPPERSALTSPCGSMLTSDGSPTAKASVAPVTAFAN